MLRQAKGNKMNKKTLFSMTAVGLYTTLGSGIVIADDGFYFTGYARYGLHYTDSVNEYVAPQGETLGHNVGRLGNEANGGEFQIGQRLTSENGTKWDVAVMVDHYSDDLNLKKFYAKVTNVFESQPGMTVWAGRDFHQRPQAGLNDYFLMSHDGQGGGFTDLQLGGVMFDASIVAQVAGTGVADNGNYAFTSKLHGIGGFSFLVNYGFASEKGWAVLDEDGDPTGELNKASSYHIAGVYDFNRDRGYDQIFLRYGDGADNSVFTRDDDLTTILAHWQGQYDFTDQFEFGYIAAYHTLDNDTPATDVDASRDNYSVIVRPMYAWTDIHSTWVEAGYSIVDYKDDGENSAWKITLSQNISYGNAKGGDRPMLRFYATFGDSSNDVAADDYVAEDTFALGAMWEAWW
jgi:maltoporin